MIIDVKVEEFFNMTCLVLFLYCAYIIIGGEEVFWFSSTFTILALYFYDDNYY